jgi:hypothetical protein
MWCPTCNDQHKEREDMTNNNRRAMEFVAARCYNEGFTISDDGVLSSGNSWLRIEDEKDSEVLALILHSDEVSVGLTRA